MIDEKRIKRFVEGAKEAFKKVDDPTFTFPITILSAYELATSIEELLKEQEAVKPIEEFIKGANRHDYHCKRCGNIVGTIFDDKHPIFPGVKVSIKHFCDVCGQAVKWE